MNNASDPVMKQEEFFQTSTQDMNTVFEIGLAYLQSGTGTLGSGGRASVVLGIGAVGEKPVESDQNEMGEDFLFHTARGLAVKVFDPEYTFADLVKLFDTPSGMVDVDELLERIALRIGQGGTQTK